MAQFDLSSIYTSDKYTSVLDLLKKLINNIDGVQYVGEDELSSLSSTVSGHTTSISTLNTNYDALNSTVSGHTTSISTLNTSVGKNTTDITELQNTVSPLGDNVDSLNTSVGKNTSDISNLTTTVSNIHTTYYTHNICILYSANSTKINISMTILLTSKGILDAEYLYETLYHMLSADDNLNCVCLYKDSNNANNNNIYTSITFSDHTITLMSDPMTPSSISFDLNDATVTDSVTPIV